MTGNQKQKATRRVSLFFALRPGGTLGINPRHSRFMTPLTVEEYAALVKKDRQTVRRWCRKGKLKSKKDAGGNDWLIYSDPTKY